MLSRGVFVKALISLLGTAAAPPHPASSPPPWERCVDNPALPYDRPLELKMRVLDGPDFDLMHYRGYPVVINVFATWCGPCGKEMPYLVEASNKFYDRGLRVIGLNDKEEDDTVRAYRKRFAVPYPIAMDARGGFVRALESGSTSTDIEFPVTLFFTPQGYLYCYVVGGMSRRELTYRIEKFLHDAPPTASPSPSPSPVHTS